MTTETISKESEARIRAGLGRVVDLVEDGLDPTAAVVKVAADLALPAGHVPLLARVFNVGRAEQHRKAAADVFEAADPFPLADAGRALEELYPARPKTAAEAHHATAVDPAYGRPAAKTAAAALAADRLRPLADLAVRPYDPPPRDRWDLCRTALGKVAAADRAAAARADEAAAAVDAGRRAMDALADAVQRSAAPVAYHVKQAEFRHGPAGAAVFARLAAGRPYLAKQAAGRRPGDRPGPADPVAGLVAAVVKAAADYAAAAAAAVAAGAEARAVRERELGPFAPAPAGAAPGRGCFDAAPAEKAAGMGLLAGAMGTTMAREIASKMPSQKPVEKMEDKMFLDLTDPKHTAEIRNAQIGAMLNQFLTDDEVIKGYDPEEVVNHFNGIAQLMPHGVTQTELMRALLRKRLQHGALDPYEVDMMLKMENSLKTRERPKSTGVMYDGAPV